MKHTVIVLAGMFLLATGLGRCQTASNGVPTVRLEKTKFALGEDVFFWVGVEGVGHAPIPKEYWNTCRLITSRPNGTVKTDHVGWPIDGPPGSGWSGGSGLYERPMLGRYTLEMQFAGKKSAPCSFVIEDVPLLRKIKAEWVFGKQSLLSGQSDMPVTLTIHNGSNQVIRFPHRNADYMVGVTLSRLDKSSTSSFSYPSRELLVKDEESQTGSHYDMFTWATSKEIATITLKPGETYRQQLSVQTAVKEDNKSWTVLPGKCQVEFSTTLSVLIGEANGDFAAFAPIRIGVVGFAIYTVGK